MTDWKAVAARIRARRESLGLTQAELEKKCGMPYNTMTQHESAARRMSDEKLGEVATALGVTEPWLRYGVVGGTVDLDALRRQVRLELEVEMTARLMACLESAGFRAVPLGALTARPDAAPTPVAKRPRGVKGKGNRPRAR